MAKDSCQAGRTSLFWPATGNDPQICLSSISAERVTTSSRSVLQKDKDKSLPSRLILYSTTSMDDAVDSATNLANDEFQTPSGAFIFAALPEANYIATSLNANLTCINVFPVELLVGPKLPNLSSTAQLTPNFPRYTRNMFEESRPVLLSRKPTPRLLLEDEITFGKIERDSNSVKWTESVQLPLKATGQKSGRRTDFFVAAIMTGGAVIAIPLLVSMGLLGRSIFGLLRGRLYLPFN